MNFANMGLKDLRPNQTDDLQSRNLARSEQFSSGMGCTTENYPAASIDECDEEYCIIQELVNHLKMTHESIMLLVFQLRSINGGSDAEALSTLANRLSHCKQDSDLVQVEERCDTPRLRRTDTECRGLSSDAGQMFLGNENNGDSNYTYPPHFPAPNYANLRALQGDGYYGLVGVETNPGPPKPKVKAKVKVVEVVKRATKKKSSVGSNRSLGSRVGSSIGGFVGDLAHKAIMGISGMGDYTVTDNTIYAGSVRSQGPPQFLQSSRPGTYRATHREYIADVFSTGPDFNTTRYPITPASVATFPWLAAIAANFEEFRIHGMVFEFVSNSADAIASTNTALGTVILATQYNSLETGFLNKLQMEQYQFAVATKPSVSCIHPLECKLAAGAPDFLFVQPLGSVSGDVRLNQFGTFTIATVGQQAPANIGSLWCSYDIVLQKTRLPSSVVSRGLGFLYARYSTAGNFNINFDATTPWTGTATTVKTVGNGTSVIRLMPNGEIHFAPGVTGNYNIDVSHVPVTNATPATGPFSWGIVSFSMNASYLNSFNPGTGTGSNFNSASYDCPNSSATTWARASWTANIQIKYSNDTTVIKMLPTFAPTYQLCNLQLTITPCTWTDT